MVNAELCGSLASLEEVCAQLFKVNRFIPKRKRARYTGQSKIKYPIQDPDDQITGWVDHLDVIWGYDALDSEKKKKKKKKRKEKEEEKEKETY